MAAIHLESAGRRLRQALAEERPLQVVGVINAYCALLAEAAGFRAIYLSGAGVSNAALGVPDLGIIGIQDMVLEVGRIAAATELPVLVDGDTGWGSSLTIRRGVRELIRAGAAGIHLEDQVDAKRCGHREGKQLVPTAEMQARITAAVEARTDPHFMIMARTDAVAVEGLAQAVERAAAYVAAGADAIFAEAVEKLEDYAAFTHSIDVPVLANMTEFGKSPLFHRDELQRVGVAMILYPLSGFRAMNAAAVRVFEAIRQQGTQTALTDAMQTRDQLYEVLHYEDQEKQQGHDGGANK